MKLKTKISDGTPLVSIIIPVYNEGEKLKKTIDSIYEYTEYPNYEVIILDDNSQDGCCDFLKNEPYNKDKKIHLITNSGKNLGVGGGRRAGAEKAQGELLFFLDGHMEMEEKWLTKIVNEFQKNPDIDILNPMIYNSLTPKEKGNLTNGYISGNISMWAPGWLNGLKSFKETIKVPFCAGGAMCVKKKIYNDIGGFPKWILGWGQEDISFSILAYLNGYNCYRCPFVWVGHYFITNLKDTNPELLKLRIRNIALNCLKSCYILYDEHDFNWVKRRLKNEKVALEEFAKILPELTSLKENIKNNSVRSYQDFSDEFKEKLPYRNIEFCVDGLEYIKSKNYDFALRSFEKAGDIIYGVGKYTTKVIKELSFIKIAEILISQKKYDEALDYLNKILKLASPYSMAMYVYMGRVFCAKAMWDDAIFWLKKGEMEGVFNSYVDLFKIDEKEFKAKLYDWYGYALCCKKEYSEAAQKYELACEYQTNQKELKRLKKNQKFCLENK